MPTNTYTALGTLTLSGADSSITFANIPATYRDLVMVANMVYTGASGDTILRINGDTGSNYSSVFMVGNGSSPSSGSESARSYMNPIYAASFGRGTMIWQLNDYSATDKHKTSLVRTDAAGARTVAMAGRWASNSAVTSITITDFASDTFAIGSTFSLYGIAS